MAIELISKIKPKGGGTFAMVDAEDVEMSDGTRLSDNSLGSYKIVQGNNTIEPGKYYVFGEVSSLDVTLVENDNGMAQEYCFEFVAASDFTTLTITPEPRWATIARVIPGNIHQVSILRGIGVMICA